MAVSAACLDCQVTFQRDERNGTWTWNEYVLGNSVRTCGNCERYAAFWREKSDGEAGRNRWGVSPPGRDVRTAGEREWAKVLRSCSSFGLLCPELSECEGACSVSAPFADTAKLLEVRVPFPIACCATGRPRLRSSPSSESSPMLVSDPGLGVFQHVGSAEHRQHVLG